MDSFYARLLARTATIDELLSDDFEALPGQKRDTDLAAGRLAAWCRSSANGDWVLFNRRLARDGHSIDQVLTKFGTVRRKPSAPKPAWLDDAIWIDQALQVPLAHDKTRAATNFGQPCAFQDLFMEVLQKAEELLWSDLDASIIDHLAPTARACLRLSLLRKLSDFCAPVLYERFCEFRKAAKTPPAFPVRQAHRAASCYDQFILDMAGGGFRRLFEAKPVLLRLMALIVRQWIKTSRTLISRLHSDLQIIRSELLQLPPDCRIVKIEDGLSDPHNGSHSVNILVFDSGARIVYKPKDLELARAWHSLIAWLNQLNPPIELKAARTIARDGYGWAEFVDHAGCVSPDDCSRFFFRAGAWLAVFHCFATTDMHQENVIAAADHPVPIDIETILQPVITGRDSDDPDVCAVEAARDILANSIMAVGLLPSYSRAIDNEVITVGALTAGWNYAIGVKWNDVNSDEMRPFSSKEGSKINPNLPHVAGQYASLAEHIGDVLCGFEAYARFLLDLVRQGKAHELFKNFEGLSVRHVIRPTRFYDMLLRRLKDHRSMDDGVLWSAQADFIARLADWEADCDPLWPCQRAERCALLSLNVPYFLFYSSERRIGDAAGWTMPAGATSGLARAEARTHAFDEREIAWQIEIIEENSKAIAKPQKATPRSTGSEALWCSDTPLSSLPSNFGAEADRIASQLSLYALRRGRSAAWIGLDWLGDSEVFQLACLGPALYNGNAGIALFLAAHASVRGSEESRELALAGISYIRQTLKGKNGARTARALGIGGATGLGSIIYALTEMATRLGDHDLLADALIAAELFSDELIVADRVLDVIGGSAGAILALLRLHRDTQLDAVLQTAQKCGEHLIGEGRRAAESGRSWGRQGPGPRRLTGMSHGAAGYSYAFASLFAATHRQEFAQAASQCIAFENSTYDPKRHNWPDFRGSGEPSWPCQWCHGAVGIGLARIASYRHAAIDPEHLLRDIRRAVDCAKQAPPGPVDTLCCGTLGCVELFREAASELGRDDLRQLAVQQLDTVLKMARCSGDYRWNSGPEKFNLGLFRGLAGIGYSLLRQIDPILPNILIWD